MRRILFRGDAKPSIGTGDLMSLLNLSHYFENDGWQTFFLIRGYESGIRIIEGKGVKNVTVIPPDCSLQEEQQVIENLIIQKGIDILFLEITERKLTDYTLPSGVKKVCVNFDGIIPDGIDMAINWDIEGAINFNKELHPKTRFLLGPQYIILPYNFDRARIAARTYYPKPQNLLIAMGGADELNFTLKVLDAILEDEPVMRITVITGAGYLYNKELEAALSKSKNSHTVKQNVHNMFEEYMGCDVAIGAGGLTSYELIATATPAILIATYAHQISRCKYFDEQGWAKYLGFRTFESKELRFYMQNPPQVIKTNIFDTRQIVESVSRLLR
ncbi:MAG: hypothetical protein L7F77_14270 [Candidatus Magnetominusculus sp. LBB02]|nr:hypothetical protein [Candidatus Magnetominusculus sp. LBB02]